MTRAITRCGRCGAKNRADWRECLRCRHVLAESNQAAAAPSGRMRWSWMAGSVVVSGIVAALAFPGRAPVASVAPVAEVPVEAEARFDAPSEPAPAPVEAVLTPITREDFARAGEAAYAHGQMSVALSAFEGAVAAFPGDADAENNLGQLLSRLGRGSEAIPHLERAAAAEPDKWSYRFNLARARGIAGDWAGAVADYRVAATMFPDDHVTLFNLGRALQKTGDHAASIEPLERAATLSPDEPSVLLLLAASYERLSRLPDAAQAYRSFLDRAPRAAEAPAIRARISRLEGVGRPDGEAAATLAPQG